MLNRLVVAIHTGSRLYEADRLCLQTANNQICSTISTIKEAKIKFTQIWVNSFIQIIDKNAMLLHRYEYTHKCHYNVEYILQKSHQPPDIMSVKMYLKLLRAK